MKHRIYGLADPRDNLIYYVGKSSSGLERPRQHARRRGPPKSLKDVWVDALKNCNLTYEIVTLEIVVAPNAPAQIPCWWNAARNPTQLNEAERWWIAYGRASGWPLTNVSEGGTGPSGMRHSESSRLQMSRSRTGKRRGPYRVVRSRRGIPQTLQTRMKLAVSAIIRYWTGDGRAALDAARSKLSDPAVRAAMSAAARRRPSKLHGECGTINGYNYNGRQKRKGLPNCGPCDACTSAASAYNSGRRPRKGYRTGEGHPQTTVTADDVKTMRALFCEGVKLPSIAQRFGLKYATVYAIVKRRTWRHVP